MLNPLNYFVLFFILVLVYSLINIKTNFINNADSQFPQLDGLRGILALSIIMHHCTIMYFYFIHGKWEVPPSIFYTLIGQVSVGLFFITTGFLFGFKIFKDNFQIRPFFISRMRRILPLQFFSVCLSFIVILAIDNFILNVPVLELILSFFNWMVYNIQTINNNPYSLIIETVYWTLSLEWAFYIILPLLFLIRKKYLNNIYFILFLSLLYFINFDSKVLMFLVGITSSLLVIKEIPLNKYILDIIGLISISSIFIYFSSAYNFIVVILLFLIFLAIIFGNYFKYLLSNKVIIFFGKISYSIYLLHNIIVFLIFHLINKYYMPLSNITQLQYWLIVFLIFNITIIISSYSYRYIEYKFYHRGHK